MRLVPLDFPHAASCLVSLVLAWSLTQLARAQDDCQLQDVQVRVSQDRTVTHRGNTLTLTCIDRVMLKKCEGLCESSVRPSVREHLGFRVNCRCCRETATTTREVVLRRCFYQNTRMPQYTHTVSVVDIEECQCQTCSD